MSVQDYNSNMSFKMLRHCNDQRSLLTFGPWVRVGSALHGLICLCNQATVILLSHAITKSPFTASERKSQTPQATK